MLITDHIEHLRKSALSDTTERARRVARWSVASVRRYHRCWRSAIRFWCFHIQVATGFVAINRFHRSKPHPGSCVITSRQDQATIYMYFRRLPQSYTTRQCHYFWSKVKRKPLVWSSVVIPAAGIAGLWNWKETDSWDGIPELKEIPFVDREVVIVPDNDIWTQKRTRLTKSRLFSWKIS